MNDDEGMHDYLWPYQRPKKSKLVRRMLWAGFYCIILYLIFFHDKA